MKKAIFWTLLLVGMVSAAVAQDSYAEWHKERIEKLTRPDGYLSLVGLSWLKESPVEVEGIGTAWVEGSMVHVDLEPGHTMDGEEVESVVLDTDRPEGEETVQRGSRSFYAIKRGDWTGLRVKDSEAPTLLGAWLVVSRLTAGVPYAVLEYANASLVPRADFGSNRTGGVVARGDFLANGTTHRRRVHFMSDSTTFFRVVQAEPRP